MRRFLACLLCLICGLTPAIAAAQNANTLSIRSVPSGGVPAIAATGVDANISINLIPKGTGTVLFGGGGVVSSLGTAGFVPVFTSPTVLSNSDFWSGPAADIIGAGASAAAWDAFIGGSTFASSQVFVNSAGILGSAGNAGFLALGTFNGPITAPTKTLTGNQLGQILFQGYAGANAFVTGPTIIATASTDSDVALPFYTLDIKGPSTLDTVRLGVVANEVTITTQRVDILGDLFVNRSGGNVGVIVLESSGVVGMQLSSGNASGPGGLATADPLVGTLNTFLSRGGAAFWQLGAIDNATPVAQTLGVQNVLAGTADTAGVAWTLNGSRGTGTGVGGDIIYQVAYPATTASTQNTLVPVFALSASNKSSSTLQTLVSLTPIVNQSGTASYIALDLNLTRTAVGSGPGQLLALRVGGVQRFGVTDGASGVGTHLRGAQAVVPTCSANCGTTVPAVVGSDFSMLVTMGSGGVPTSPFTVTFNGTYTTAPSCQAVANVTTTAFVTKVAPTATTVVVTTATNPAVSDSYNIVCTGVV